jgi:pimeloyl-ACP methyl ester carboxylesterase
VSDARAVQTTTMTLSRDGKRTLHVAAAGRNGAPLVLCLHGFPDFWRTWTGQIERLAPRYRVVAPDQRGYTTSMKPRGARAYVVARAVEDALAVMRAEGYASMRVIGHDWGGVVAWELARTAPEAVERLVVLNAPQPQAMLADLLRSGEQRRRSWYMLFFQLPWLPEWALRRDDFAALARALRGGMRRDALPDDELARYKRAWAEPGALTAMLNWYRAAGRSILGARGDGAIEVPTTVIWGDGDPALRVELAHASVAKCANAKLHVLAGARHWVHKDEPERVNALIEAALG